MEEYSQSSNANDLFIQQCPLDIVPCISNLCMLPLMQGSLQDHTGGLLYLESHQGSCLHVIRVGMHFVPNYRQWAINALKWNEKEELFAKPLLFSLPITHKSLFKKSRNNSKTAQKLEEINNGSVHIATTLLFSWQHVGILQAGSMSTSGVLPCITGAAATNPVF